MDEYVSLVKKKTREAGNFATVCNISGASNQTAETTFLVDNALPFEYIVEP